jgi:hypothetical protein
VAEWSSNKARIYLRKEAASSMSETAHLVQMFDSTVVQADVSAAGAKGGSTGRRSAAHAVASQPRFI